MKENYNFILQNIQNVHVIKKSPLFFYIFFFCNFFFNYKTKERT